MPQPEPEKSISVVLVDDHLLVRSGFRRMLEDDPAIRVVGERATGRRQSILPCSAGPM